MNLPSPNPEWLFRQIGYAPLRSTSSEIVKTVGLVAAGVVIGAACVALFTPKSGPQLRTDLVNKAGQLRTRGMKKVEELQSNADGMRDRIGDELSERV